MQVGLHISNVYPEVKSSLIISKWVCHLCLPCSKNFQSSCGVIHYFFFSTSSFDTTPSTLYQSDSMLMKFVETNVINNNNVIIASGTPTGLCFFTQFLWHKACGKTSNWRCCLSLEALTSIPARFTIIYRFLCRLHAFSCARASKLNHQICVCACTYTYIYIYIQLMCQ